MALNKRNLKLKTVVDAIRPRAARYMVWDASLPRFGIDVHPTGVKAWIFFYRVNGQPRRMTLGRCDTMTTEQARVAVTELQGQVNKGIDPLALKRTTGGADGQPAKRATVAVVAERYLASLAKRSASAWAKEARRIYDAHIEPALGARDVREVAIKDVRTLHESLSETPVSANRMKAVLSAIITRAIADEDRPRELLNPAGAVEDYPETERDRYLSDKEWLRLAKAIRTMRTELEDAPAWDTRGHQLDALLLLALTGARLRSILPRTWDDADWQEHALSVTPAHKGVSRILLGDSAESHLRACFDARGAAGGFIFPGQERRLGKRTRRHERDTRPKRAPTSISGLGPMWAHLSDLAALENFTLHDFRRTFATVAGDVGISDHLIGGLLGHRVPGVRRRYARRTDTALLEAATKVSAEVAKRLEVKLDGARKSVPFPLKQSKRGKR